MTYYALTVILLALCSAMSAEAAETYLVNGKPSGKIQAVKTLITNPKAQVIRCQEVELKENKASVGFKVKKDK